MIITFTDFINENFQFEHDVEKEFDYINNLCFNNEIQKVPIEFVNIKRSKMFVELSALKNYELHKIIITVKKLCISKYYHFTPQQFRDCLAHEMIHVLLGQRQLYKDRGGHHGMYFQNEMYRINNIKVGITVGLKDDENINSIGMRVDLKDKEGKTVYILLFKEINSLKQERFNVSPFSNKEMAQQFWDRMITKEYPYRLKTYQWASSIFECTFGETNLSDVSNELPISRKTGHLYVINDEFFNKILTNTTVYENKTLKND